MTTKNIQNLADIIQQQQMYTTVLGEYINTLYTKLAQLEQQIQVHSLYPHNPIDEVQLEAPAYDPSIDGHLKQPKESTDAKEENTSSPVHTENSVQQSLNRIENIASSFQGPTMAVQPKPDSEERRSEDISSIQELEKDKDWEDGLFQDADLNHLQDSDRIRQEYSAHFIKEPDQEQYYKQDSFQNPTPKTICLNWTTITLAQDLNQVQNTKIQTFTCHHPQTQQTLNTGIVAKVGDVNADCNSTVTGYLEKKHAHLRAG